MTLMPTETSWHFYTYLHTYTQKKLNNFKMLAQ